MHMFWLMANRCNKMGKDRINKNLLKFTSCDVIKLTCPQISSRDTCNIAKAVFTRNIFLWIFRVFVQDYLFGYTCCYQLHLFSISSFNHMVQNKFSFLPLNSSFHKLKNINDRAMECLLAFFFLPVFHSWTIFYCGTRQMILMLQSLVIGSPLRPYTQRLSSFAILHWVSEWCKITELSSCLYISGGW